MLQEDRNKPQRASSHFGVFVTWEHNPDPNGTLANVKTFYLLSGVVSQLFPFGGLVIIPVIFHT